jgi:hypothetical protein
MQALGTITLENGDHDAWVCICGNTPASAGFYPCDLNGNLVEPTEKDWTTNLYVCDDCGRIIDQDTLSVVGRNLKLASA